MLYETQVFFIIYFSNESVINEHWTVNKYNAYVLKYVIAFEKRKYALVSKTFLFRDHSRLIMWSVDLSLTIQLSPERDSLAYWYLRFSESVRISTLENNFQQYRASSSKSITKRGLSNPKLLDSWNAIGCLMKWSADPLIISFMIFFSKQCENRNWQNLVVL